jgi:imidazolonepropionase-like amidohydrolase
MLILRGGQVLTMEQPPFEGDVAIDGGKILACAPHLDIPDADVMDLSGRFVMPGIIDAHCHVGLLQSGSRERDHNETTDPITPEMRAIDAIWPGDMVFAEARACGITTCVTGPGSINLIGGTFAAVSRGCVWTIWLLPQSSP